MAGEYEFTTAMGVATKLATRPEEIKGDGAAAAAATSAQHNVIFSYDGQPLLEVVSAGNHAIVKIPVQNWDDTEELKQAEVRYAHLQQELRATGIKTIPEKENPRRFSVSVPETQYGQLVQNYLSQYSWELDNGGDTTKPKRLKFVMNSAQEQFLAFLQEAAQLQGFLQANAEAKVSAHLSLTDTERADKLVR